MRRLPALLVTIAALAATSASAQSGPTARGGLLVQRHCASCHAVRRTGDSPNPDAPAFRDLHARYRIEDLAEALSEGILTGHPAMPEFRFQPHDVKAIIAYLKSIQALQTASSTGPFS
jgi:cytochrome c